MCKFLRGAVTFNEVRNMPVKQYMILKIACELEEIASRRKNIQDINRAFHDPKPLMDMLKKEENTLLHKLTKKATLTDNLDNVNWNADTDWKSKIRKMQI